jgi:hypothetical protein
MSISWWQAVAAGMIDKRKGTQDAITMCFRVERLKGEEDIVVLGVSGRINAEDVDTLRELLEQEKGKVAIDLREVTLVNREAISFLALCEANGVELRSGADYIREWVTRVRRRMYRSYPKTGGGGDFGDL